jgi:hypothetical protein
MKLTINLDAASAGHLTHARYSLYAFRAVDIINAAALPTVWCRLAPPFLEQIQVTWESSLSAFISTTEVAAGKVIATGYSAAIAPGQTLRIEAERHTVVRQDSPEAITFDNQSEASFTCGIAQSVNGDPGPLCAFPVTPRTQQGVRPANAILLLFSTAEMEVGTVVTDPPVLRKIGAGGHTAFANQTEGILVTDIAGDHVASYSHQNGSWTRDSVSTPVKPSELVVPLLIRSS